MNNTTHPSNCDCCKGLERLTPQNLANDPSLDTLLYRVGTHSTFKESMLSGLSAEIRLRDLTTREDQDPSIALIDTWAMVLDVLTFYQERIINEGYLRTANERLSLVELAKHFSYRPQPGVAAETWLAIEMDEARGAPTQTWVEAGTKVQSIPEQDEKPQLFETEETILIRPEWNALRPQLRQKQSLPKGSTSIYLQGINTQLQPGDQLLIVGAKRFNTSTSNEWDIRTIELVTPDTDAQLTRVSWRVGLGHDIPDVSSGSPIRVYVFRQRAAIFGYNAPHPKSLSGEVLTNYTGEYDNGKHVGDWKKENVIEPGKQAVFLDRTYPEILVGSWLVLAAPTYTELYRAKQVESLSKSEFTLSGKSTRIVLDTVTNLAKFGFRETVIFAQSEELLLAEAPVRTPVFGNTIMLNGVQADLAAGQQLIVSGELMTHVQVTDRQVIRKRGNTEVEESKPLNFTKDKANKVLETGEVLEVAGVPQRLSTTKMRWPVTFKDMAGTVDADDTDLVSYVPRPTSAPSELPTSLNQPIIVSERVTIASVSTVDGFTQIELSQPLQRIYRRETFKINANVAYATHGETKTEVLGSGDGSKKFQKFFLKHHPLTYIAATSASGTETTLEVRVNDILWQEVPSFYGRKSDERIYITRQEDDGSTYVQFGDGITGARLPTGLENIKATYRMGIGFAGLLKAGQLSMLLTPQLWVKSVINPLPPSGADEPESLDNIRRNAPLSVLTMDRAASVQDFEDFANAYAGIAKAKAELLWKGEQSILYLTVAAADEGPVSAELANRLVMALDNARHNNFAIRVDSYAKLYFGIKASLVAAPGYTPEAVLDDATVKLQNFFAFGNREFGQDVTPGEVIAVLQSVNGVLSVDLDKLDEKDTFAAENFRLIAEVARWEEQEVPATGSTQAKTETILLPAHLLLIDPLKIDLTIKTNENQYTVPVRSAAGPLPRAGSRAGRAIAGADRSAGT